MSIYFKFNNLNGNEDTAGGWRDGYVHPYFYT